jgi:hypothetical protein
MALNKSTNKVSVMKGPTGGRIAVGLQDPQVGMVSQYGTILAIQTGSGEAIISRGSSSGLYPVVFLEIGYIAASSNFGFASGHGNAVSFGHYSHPFTNFSPLGSGSISSYKLGVNNVEPDVRTFPLAGVPSLIAN